MTDELRAALEALVCGCRVEIVDDTLHLFACCTEHARAWDESLPGLLADLGLAGLPIVTEP